MKKVYVVVASDTGDSGHRVEAVFDSRKKADTWVHDNQDQCNENGYDAVDVYEMEVQ